MNQASRRLHTRVTAIMSLFLLALVVVFHPAFAQPPTLITVNTIDDELNSDGDCSLREAITATNTNAAVDACAAGVPGADTIGFDVTGTITLGSSLPAINDSLTIAGPGAANLTISGNNAVRVLTVNAGIKLSVQDLTIANGNAIDGGGIYNNFGVVELVNSTLSGNKADYYGGGIYSNGTLTIRSSTLSGNSASPYFSGLGGGIYIRGGTLTLIQSTLSGNSANCFGCIGGGILNYGSATIVNSTFSENSARGGGAIHTYGPVTITSSTLANNKAGIPGGGGAISSYGGIVTLRSTIISNNVGGNCFINPLTVTNAGYNLVFPNVSGGTTCGIGIPSADPLLGPLQNNGGPTSTYALLAGSPAIDAIPPADCSAVNTDQRSVTRPQGSACDIGAFEFSLPNQPPTADARGPYTVNEGASITITASGSDPEGGSLTYAWDLDNDGSFETSGQSVIFSAASLDGLSSHTIAVQVTDNGDLTATGQTTVNVLNVAPTAGFTNASGTLIQGQSATLVVSNQFDPGVADTAAGFLYSYDCTNDGTFEISDSSSSSAACSYPNAGAFNARGRIADKDGDYTDYMVAVTVLTPREGIAGLIEQVNALVAAGVLNQGQGNGLIAKLEAALQQLDHGNTQTAVNQLQAFVNQMNAFISAGTVSPAQGQPLIDAATAIIAALQGAS